MADVSRDLDRYLRKRRVDREERRAGKTGGSFFDRMFSSARQQDDEDFSSEERAELNVVEQNIRDDAREIEMVRDVEEELENRQERDVSFYHKLTRWFGRKPAEEEEPMEMPMHAPVEDEHTTEDVRTLAEISMRWLSRLPTRIRDEFKDSDDYLVYTSILERRGIAKKK